MSLIPKEKRSRLERRQCDTYYLDESFPVKDAITNKTRQVRLQGRLRIVAVFYGRWGTGRTSLEGSDPLAPLKAPQIQTAYLRLGCFCG